MIQPLLSFVLLLADGGSGHVISARDEAAWLSVRLQVPVTVAKPIEGDLIYIEPHGAGPSALLKAVASSLHASVIRDAKGLRIERTSENLKALNDALTAQRLGWIKQALQRSKSFRETALKSQSLSDATLTAMDKDVRAFQDWSDQKSTRFNERNPELLLPSHELLEDLATRVGLAKIAAVRTGASLIFEDQPISWAEPLPQHEDLTATYASQMAGLPRFEIPESVKTHMMFWDLLYSPIARQWNRASYDLSRLRLRVSGNTNGLELSLEGYDPSGNLVLNSQDFMGSVQHNVDFKTLQLEEKKQRAAGDDSDLIPLSQETLEALKFPKLLAPTGPDWCFHPDQAEPLDAIRGLFSTFANEAPSKCFVMAVTDGMRSTAALAVEHGSLNKKLLKKVWDEHCLYERVETDTNVIWRPNDPEYAEAGRADRRVLASFVKKVRTTKQVTMRDVAVLYHDASKNIGSLPQTYALQALNELNVRLDVSDRWLQFIGAINDLDWEALSSGNTIRVAQAGIGPDFERLIKFEYGQKPSGPEPVPDIYTHNEELYPSGEIGSAKMSLATGQAPLHRTWHKDQPAPKLSQYWMPNPMTIGSQSVRSMNGGVPQFTLSRDMFESIAGAWRYQAGTETDHTIKIGLPLNLEISQRLSFELTAEDQIYSYEDFSQEQRDAFWKAACDQALAFYLAHPGQPIQGLVTNPPPQ